MSTIFMRHSKPEKDKTAFFFEPVPYGINIYKVQTIHGRRVENGHFEVKTLTGTIYADGSRFGLVIIDTNGTGKTDIALNTFLYVPRDRYIYEKKSSEKDERFRSMWTMNHTTTNGAEITIVPDITNCRLISADVCLKINNVNMYAAKLEGIEKNGEMEISALMFPNRQPL